MTGLSVKVLLAKKAAGLTATRVVMVSVSPVGALMVRRDQKNHAADLLQALAKDLKMRNYPWI